VVLKGLQSGLALTLAPLPAALLQHADLLPALAGNKVWWLSSDGAMELPARVVPMIKMPNQSPHPTLASGPRG